MPFTVGLAGKDEELFVVCLKELKKAVDVVETEPMVDLFKAFAERQAFGIDVTRSYPSWVLKPCVILASGCCDVCGKQLRKEPLSLAAKHELASEVESLILSRASRSAASAVETRKTKEDRVENFLAFKAFLAKTGPYDIFLDGANIAHYKQNFDGGGFNYQQIQMVRSTEAHPDRAARAPLQPGGHHAAGTVAGAGPGVQGGEGQQRRPVLDVRGTGGGQRRDGEDGGGA